MLRSLVGSEMCIRDRDSLNLDRPRLIQDSFNKQPVVSVSCGLAHSGAITRSGELHVWGWDEYGQLGLGSFAFGKTKTRPVRLKSLQHVAKIACGGSFSVVLTQDGQLHSFGWGRDGQLGHGWRHQSGNSPKTLTGLTNVMTVACSGSHVMASTSTGSGYTWGNGATGKLGHGDESKHGSPERVEALAGKFQVHQVSCSGGISDGHSFFCGVAASSAPVSYTHLTLPTKRIV
eukprot:TRINITY_DN9426_c0_g1_i1.p1 TRINITY_DN9426_c0_g1~~TRINITY_DN9426_c0_g1_i1.p1  ORF type:complete len:271 (+),score=66.87 TRINITY_DN9426_c0_g1_i1:118-813(+)